MQSGCNLSERDRRLGTAPADPWCSSSSPWLPKLSRLQLTRDVGSHAPYSLPSAETDPIALRGADGRAPISLTAQASGTDLGLAEMQNLDVVVLNALGTHTHLAGEWMLANPIRRNRIVLEFNSSAVREAGLFMSAQLLRLAEAVR